MSNLRGDPKLPDKGKMDERHHDQTTAEDSGGPRSTASDDAVGKPGEMSALLDALGKLAREEQAIGLTVSPEVIPVLSGTAKDRIASRILQVQLDEQKIQRRMSTSSTFQLVAKKRRPVFARWKLAFGSVAAAAAVLVLVLNGPAQDHYSALPGYAVSATGGVKTMRGGAANGLDEESAVTPVQIIGRDTELKVFCRPQTAVGGAIAVRAFFVRDGQSNEIRPRVRMAPTGAVELTARANDVFEGAPTHGSVRIVVGRPDAVRAMNPNRALDATSPVPEARWLTVPVETL
jgi:hypothetical protein